MSSASLLYGQVGLKVALNRSNLSQDNYDYTSNSAVNFFQIGLTTKLKRDEPGFRAEFLYSKKGREFSSENTIETSYGSQSYKTTYTDHIPYFDMPLLFTFPVHELFIIEAGPNFAARLGGKRISKSTFSYYYSSSNSTTVLDFPETEYKYSDKNAFPDNREAQPEYEDKLNKNLIRRFDVGLNIGCQLFLTGKMTFVARYNFGLTDVVSNNYYNFYTSNLSTERHRNLELGLTFYMGN